jgi:outer membrane protein
MTQPLFLNNYKKILPALAVLLFMSFTMLAQQQPLTLTDALQYALKNKAEARKAQLDIENAQYKIDETKAGALPQISATGGVTYNPMLQITGLPGELSGQPGKTTYVALGQKWNISTGVTLNQKLYDPALMIAMKAQKATKEYYLLAAKNTDEQIIEAVASNYYQVLVQRQKIVVLDSNIINTTKTRDILKSLFENGLAKKIDLDRTNVNISNLQANRQQLTNDLQLQENNLKFYMGMPIDSAIEIPSTAFEKIIPQTVLPEPVDVNNRSEYQLLQKQEQLLQYQKKSVQTAYYPSLSFSGSYNYQGIGNKFPVGKGSSSGVNWFDNSSLGITLTVPIFNGFATRARVRQADVSIRRNKEDMKLTALSLNLDYENAKTQISNNLVTLSNQKENIKLAEDVLANTKNNYNNGLATLTDLLDAESSLTQAQNNYSTALLNYKLAEIQILKSKGSLKSLLN